MADERIAAESGARSLRRRLEAWSFQIIIGVIVFLFIFLALEFVVRMAERAYGAVPAEIAARPEARSFSWRLGEYRFFPYLMHRAPPRVAAAGDNIETNSRGLRCPEFTTRKPPGVWRLIVVGGSAVWGVGVAQYKDTLVGMQAELLSAGADKPRVEVINAGQLGYNSTQEFIFLANELIEYEPDFVVFFNGFNDLNGSLDYRQIYGEDGVYWEIPHDFVQMKSAVGLWDHKWKLPLDALLSNSHLLRRLGLTLVKRPKNLSPDELRYRGKLIIETYRRNLENDFAILKNRGIKGAVVVQPVLPINKTMSLEERKIVNDLKSLSKKHDILIEVYPKLLEAAQAAASKTGATCWDFTDVFKGYTETLFWDPVHPNQAGNKIIGQKLAELLKPYVQSNLEPTK